VAGVSVVARQNISAQGGTLAILEQNLTLAVPADALAGRAIVAELDAVSPESLPKLPDGFAIGSNSLNLVLRDAATGEPIMDLPVPLALTWRVNAGDLHTALDQAARVRWAAARAGAWQALPCSSADDGATLTCAVAHAGLISVLIAPPIPDVQDWDVPNGHFYLQSNGFSGAGNLGYAVVDDADAAFWTEFQRFGGVEQLGFPITARMQHKGFVTQAFQKLALQWRPELGQAVPVNVLDDLNQRGADNWLDSMRQVPPAGDTSGDVARPFDEVVSSHLALLDAYPELASFYQAQSDPLTRFGLPLGVKDYGTFVAVRLQRATLQLWTVDTPFAREGTVVAGNGSDLAKEVGLWPPEATVPSAALRYGT